MGKSSGGIRNTNPKNNALSNYRREAAIEDAKTEAAYREGIKNGQPFNEAIAKKVIKTYENDLESLKKEINKEKEIIKKLQAARKKVVLPKSDGSTADALNYRAIYQRYQTELSSFDVKINNAKRHISEAENKIKRANSILRYNNNFLNSLRNGKK